MSRYSRMAGRGLYRSRDGIILGVCRGVADYFDFSPFWVRGIVVILLIITGLWPVIGLYILAALLMKTAPATDAGTGSKQTGGGGNAFSRHDRVERLKRKWKHLEKRIRRMEDRVTSREFDWNSRFHG